ncbi:MAG: hypothetical protein H8D67_21360 [Deltaproteobacteria bacterium]|nr:hypothetical protein [Deltaproteobacteria bacterium]
MDARKNVDNSLFLHHYMLFVYIISVNLPTQIVKEPGYPGLTGCLVTEKGILGRQRNGKKYGKQQATCSQTHPSVIISGKRTKITIINQIML